MSAKENNKNAGNSQNAGGTQKKKFLGGNINLAGKTFELTSSRDCVHQYAETVKRDCRLCWSRIHPWR